MDTLTKDIAETLESRLRAELDTVEGNLAADLYDAIRARTDSEWERVAAFAASMHENAIRAELLQRKLREAEAAERAAEQPARVGTSGRLPVGLALAM